MWVEVVGAKTGKKILINTDFIQSVYEPDGKAVVIDLGGYANNYFEVVGSYKDIRDLITEGEWKR